MVAVLEDLDVVVAEIVSIAVEVVPAMVVNASPTEDVAVIVMLLTLLILKLMLLLLLKDVVLPDIQLLNLLQVVFADRVVMWLISLVVTTVLPFLSGDDRKILLVVIGDVKVMVDPLLILLIMQTSTNRAKVTLTKDAQNITTPVEKNSTATNSRKLITRKVERKKKNSIMWKLVNKKWNRPRMLIGLMNLVSDIRR